MASRFPDEDPTGSKEETGGLQHLMKELGLEDLFKEINNIVASEHQVSIALKARKDRLRITKKCLTIRKKRIGGDLLYEDMQNELRNEKQIIEVGRNWLIRTLKQTGWVALDEWEGISCSKAVAMKAAIDSFSQQAEDKMQKQLDNTDRAFYHQIMECKDAMDKLQDDLNRITAQIKEQKETIASLELSIKAEEAAVEISQTPLEELQQRPHRELTIKAEEVAVEISQTPLEELQQRPHLELSPEVQERATAVAELKARLRDANRCLKGLVRQQLELDKEITINVNIVLADYKCLQLRKNINIPNL